MLLFHGETVHLNDLNFMIKNKLLKGFQDFLPEVMIARQKMIETIIRVFERYGFVPQDTPALEYADLLMGKYDENEKLIYRFKDHGGRDVALRYDLTVPLARVISMHKQIPMPYKRYQISKVWRADRPQKGRLREFVQFDADVIGSQSPIVDIEIIAMMCDAMKALGVPNVLVRINDRRLLDGLCHRCGLDSEQSRSLMTAMDKMDKIGIDEVKLEWKSRGFRSMVWNRVQDYVSLKDSADRFDQYRKFFKGNASALSGIKNMECIFSDLKQRGQGNGIIFDPAIVRGLSYYTSTIYETMITDLPEFGSVMGGGRFDHLIKQLGGPDLPGVGTSIGVDRLFSALQKKRLLPTQKTSTRLLVINMDQRDHALYGSIVQTLRDRGISCEIYPDAKKILDQFQHADRQNIPFLLIIGEKEKSRGVWTLRNQKLRTEQKISNRNFDALILEVNKNQTE